MSTVPHDRKQTGIWLLESWNHVELPHIRKMLFYYKLICFLLFCSGLFITSSKHSLVLLSWNQRLLGKTWILLLQKTELEVSGTTASEAQTVWLTTQGSALDEMKGHGKTYNM